MTTPPYGRMPINKEQTENALKFQEAELVLKKARFEALKARSLAERQWITWLSHTAEKSAGGNLNHAQSQHPAIVYTQALQNYYETELNILTVDLKRSEAQIELLKWTLQEGERNVLATN